MSKVYEIFGCPKRDGLAFGCEFELESINATGVGFDALFSAVTDDNSLRNNGKEFITKPTGKDCPGPRLHFQWYKCGF